MIHVQVGSLLFISTFNLRGIVEGKKEKFVTLVCYDGDHFGYFWLINILYILFYITM